MIVALYIITRLMIIFKVLLCTIEEGKVSFILSIAYPFLFWIILIINPLLSLLLIWAFPIPIFIFALKRCSIKKLYFLNLLELLIEYITVWIPSAVNSAALIDSYSSDVYFLDIHLFTL